jgi:uncharacterized protein (TIGR03435 family)
VPQSANFAENRRHADTAAAYGVVSDRVSGSSWIAEAEYVLEAKVPPGATKEQAKLMLQKALEERFRLSSSP